jgi:4'-phosphopantetheinyl transferase
VLLRAALRTALSAALRIDPACVPLAATAAGRPFVAMEGRSLDVSCSASAGIGVVVVARGHRVGVDIQQVAPWSAGVLDEGWLAVNERQALATLPLEARPEATTRAWTQKEAVLKARGTGLLDDPAAVVTPVGRPTGVIAGWTVESLHVPAGWVASLAVGPLEEWSS